MSEGGVSQSELNGLRRECQSAIHDLDRRIGSLEAEMGEATRILERILERLSEEHHGSCSCGTCQIARGVAQTNEQLDAMHRKQEEMHSTLDSSLHAQERTLTVTEVGLAATTAATMAVNGSVRRNTNAIVQTDVLRVQGDAQAPLSQLRGFAAEIEERFGQALVGVAINRQLYDQHFQHILTGYEKNLRAIGEHIYRIMEDEFVPAVQDRVVVPRTVYQELALEVDRQRIAMRSRRLEDKLAQFDQSELDPLLEMHHRFETAISNEYSVELPSGTEEIAVPGALRVWVDGEADVIVGTRTEADASRRATAGIGFQWRDDPRYADLRTAAQIHAGEVAREASFRPLNTNELQNLRASLVAKAEAGMIDGDLLPGMFAYLNAHGLEVTEDCVAILDTADVGGKRED